MDSGQERRKTVLSDEDFERLATRAKELALRDIYVAVGKSVITKALWVFGASAALIWAGLKFFKNG